MIARLPRPLRFMGVGGFCLLIDLTGFTILIRRGMDPPARPLHRADRRHPRSHGVLTDDNYRNHMAMIRLDLDMTFPTLHLVGRNGMHRYNNQDHAMMTAMLTARNILAGERRYDVWNVNEDAEYHEAGMAGVKEALASERLVPQKIGEAETAVT